MRARALIAALAVATLTATAAWALGLELGQSKEELKLDYQVEVTDHKTGRVTVVLTIAREGRLKPLTDVELMVPSQDGTGYVDMAISLATRPEGGKQVARVHLKRELAERAHIHLKTLTLDGKQDPLTWYYHRIPLADLLKPAAVRTARKR